MTLASNIFKAILSRLLFVGHSLVTIYWVSFVTKNPSLWYLAVILVALGIETVQCIVVRKGEENKWISFSIICYLATTIPCAWIMELHLLEQRLKDKEPPDNVNASTVPPTTAKKSDFTSIIGIENFTDLIEQTTLLILILGRWLLPKGSLSRESLSQLLLVNLAMSADIVEFFDILKLKQAQKSKDLVLTILSLWTISLVQFPVNGAAKIETSKDDTEQPASTTAKTTRATGRRQSRVFPETTLRQAPLSDRKLSVIAPQIRRLSMQQIGENSGTNDVLSQLPDTQIKKLKTQRHSLAVSENTNFPDVISRDIPLSPRRPSFDVNKVRNNNNSIGERSTQEYPFTKNFRTLSRDIPNRSRASIDITAERFNSSVHFERMGSVESGVPDDDKPRHRVTMDLIGTTMALFLQDGPFLTFRLYVIAKYSAIQYMIVFLTVKNALLLVLQIYKITVQHCVCHDHKDNDFSPENHVDATSRLNNVQIAVIHEGNRAKKAGVSSKRQRGRYSRFSARFKRDESNINGSGPLFQSRQIP